MEKNVNDHLEAIHSHLVYQDFKNSTSNAEEIDWSAMNYRTPREIENQKRRKLRYYYSGYSFKKLFFDFFGIIIFNIFYFIFVVYRHKKHQEIVQRVQDGEFNPEDFKEDTCSLREEDYKFLNVEI